MEDIKEKILNDFMKGLENENCNPTESTPDIEKDILRAILERAKEDMERHEAEEAQIREDNKLVYDRIMQGIEEIGEACEEYECLEDPEEKSRRAVRYSENLRTLASLAQARGNLIKAMRFW